MNVAKNYKNICLSLAKRQTFAQAVTIAERPLKDRLSYQSGKIELIKNLKSANMLNHNIEDRCFSPKEMVFNGVQFRINCIVAVKDSGQNLPVFGEIQEIVVLDNTPRMLLVLWDAIDFDDFLQAYQVETTNQLQLIFLDNIYCHTTFAFWKKYNDNTHYISKRFFNGDF